MAEQPSLKRIRCGFNSRQAAQGSIVWYNQNMPIKDPKERCAGGVMAATHGSDPCVFGRGGSTPPRRT